MGLLTVGVTGLNAAQMGIQTAGHNIANASTPGFNRQQITQTTSNPTFSGAGFIGQGVTVSNVLRVYNEFQSKQVLNSETVAAQLSIYSSEIAQIDNMLADPNAGLSPAMQAFFNSVEEAAANPSSIPARQAMLSAAQGMVARFQSIDQRIGDMRSGINQQISFESASINSYVQQLKDINQRIIVAQSSGQSLQANDLLDQRDQLVSELNKEIRVTTHNETDGTTSVFFGNGQPLLVGASAFQLQALPSREDLTSMEVSLKDTNGNVTRIPESLVNGGKLGGLLQFRSETLDSAQNSLGRIATVFSATFNAQHRLGQDLTGAMGGDFFSVAQGTQLFLPSTANTGTANIAVTLDDTSTLTTSNYRLTLTATNTFSLVRLSDNKVWTAAGSNQASAMASLMKSVNADQPQGFSLALSGTSLMSIGDSFLVRPTRFGARDITLVLGDPRNIALAAPIRTQASIANAGTAKISAGAVGSIASVLSGPVTVSYEASSNTLSGFPVGATVDVGSQTYQISSSTQRIPYISGANISFNGTAAKITGVPADGDTFTITPPLFTPLFGAPTTGGNWALASTAPTVPLTVVAGANDSFNVTVDGAAQVTATLAPGVYSTPASLVQQMQNSINAALAAAAQAGTVSVSLAQNNLLQVTSNLPAGSVALAAFSPAPNYGLTSMFGVPAASTTRGASIGSLAPSLPLTVASGVNDQFDINVDGAGLATKTVAAGTYSTAAALAAAVQTAIGAGVTVSVDAASQNLVVTSTTTGGGSSVVLAVTGGNTGLATMFGAPVAGNRTQISGGAAPASPIVAGINDRFRISVDGGSTVVATIPAGTYTAAALASQMQTSLNASLPAPGSVTVSVVGGMLVVTSGQVGGASSVSLSSTNQGAGVLSAGSVTRTNSLPSTPITFKYLEANSALGLPARLTGLPVGSVVTVTPAYGGTPSSYTIYQPTDYIPYTSEASITFNGISFSISGQPVDGDTFAVGPNPTGVSDNRNALLLGNLQTQNTLSGGTATYQSAYSQLVSEVGNKARELEVTSAAQDTLVKQGQDMIQSESGVNLDEEAANLMRFQQAYQASAKMIQVAGKLFDVVLSLGQ
ncbi:MAG: flagellar hook-associated protein FlgK [Sterolibacterium sp.]|nr:flagellar hook-associated protein FlgK [Sterolibacterium sp.]